MPSRIQRLSEAIANQIAAGEVVQRPASVVKELMENALDAGATQIRVIVRDAGKSLIQVLDNGCGMGEEDARMCFERHATSKISRIEDLFNIRTMGFRGEALAAISSVAKVELKTRRSEDETGRRVVVDASRLVEDEECQTAQGSSISVQHLFYNVPARRNFLRSATAELRRITEEFQRFALANPDLQLTLENNGVEVYNLRPSNARQRVVAVLGKSVNERLVPVSEQTPLLTIEGFVGKPESARKMRGEQYFYLNGRFFRSPHLQHAVFSNYEKLIPEKHFPLFVLFLETDPGTVDVNVHPTKEELRFEDEKMIYAVIQAAVRHALSRYSATPSLDFDVDPDMAHLEAFQRPGATSFAPMKRSASGARPWEALFEIAARERAGNAESERVLRPQGGFRQEDALGTDGLSGSETEGGPEFRDLSNPMLTLASAMEQAGVEQGWEGESPAPFQLHGRYVMSAIKNGLIVLDQRAAHERILFEKYLGLLKEGRGGTQRQLFPQTLELSAADAVLMRELLPEVRLLGFDLEPFGGEAFVVHGYPAECEEMYERPALDELMEAFRRFGELRELSARERVARGMARTYSIKSGRKLSTKEMRELIDSLFACELPQSTPDGHPTFYTLSLDEIASRFKKRQG